MNSQPKRESSSPGRPSADAAAAVDQLREALSFSDGQPLETARALEAFVVVLPVLEKLEALCHEAFKGLSGQHVKPETVRTLFSRYLAGEADTSIDAIKERVTRLQNLAGVLLFVLPQTPELVTKITSDLAPERIEEWVADNRNPWNVLAKRSPDACWQRYCDLVSRREPPGEALKQEILRQIAALDRTYQRHR